MGKPAQIVIYLPDDDELGWWTDHLRDLGFVDTDWCGMRAKVGGATVDYGPCEPRRGDGDGVQAGPEVL